MTRKRRRFEAPFRAKVALAAVRGDKTTAELASKFDVHGNQVAVWKKQLLEGAVELFEDGRLSRQREAELASEAALYEQIGRLQMELAWLKKKAAELG